MFHRFAGFDVMSLSNNHLNDYGEKPLNFTKELLNSVGIQSFGYNYNQYDTPQVLAPHCMLNLNLLVINVEMEFLCSSPILPFSSSSPSDRRTKKNVYAFGLISAYLIPKREVAVFELLQESNITVIMI